LFKESKADFIQMFLLVFVWFGIMEMRYCNCTK